MKKLLAILLSIFLVVSVLPISVFAEGEVTTYEIYLGKNQVTSENMNDILGNGTAYYVPGENGERGTLYLNGAYHRKSYKTQTFNNTGYMTGLIISEPTNVVLSGSNTFGYTLNGLLASNPVMGMYISADVTFSGNGTLTLLTHAVKQSIGTGIEENANVVIGDNVTIRNSVTGYSSGTAYGVYANALSSITVKDNATLTAAAADSSYAPSNAYGLYAYASTITMSDNATINAYVGHGSVSSRSFGMYLIGRSLYNSEGVSHIDNASFIYNGGTLSAYARGSSITTSTNRSAVKFDIYTTEKINKSCISFYSSDIQTSSSQTTSGGSGISVYRNSLKYIATRANNSLRLENDYGLIVGEYNVSNKNMNDIFGDGTVSFVPGVDGTPGKLTLNNLNATATDYVGSYYNNDYYIKSFKDIDIELVGENTVTVNSSSSISKLGFVGVTGHTDYNTVKPSVRFVGNGSLDATVNAPTTKSSSTTVYAYDVYADGNISFNDSVNVNLNLNNTNSSYIVSRGVYTPNGDVIVNDSANLQVAVNSVKTSDTNACIRSINYIQTGANTNVKLTGANSVNGIFVNNFNISDGEFEASTESQAMHIDTFDGSSYYKLYSFISVNTDGTDATEQVPTLSALSNANNRYVKITRGGKFGIVVNNVRVTADNYKDILGDGTVYIDTTSTPKLVLNNANITEGYDIYQNEEYPAYVGLYLTENIPVEFINSTIDLSQYKYNELNCDDEAVEMYGVYADGFYTPVDLTFVGYNNINTRYVGVQSFGNINIADDSSLNITLNHDDYSQVHIGLNGSYYNINLGENAEFNIFNSTAGTGWIEGIYVNDSLEFHGTNSSMCSIQAGGNWGAITLESSSNKIVVDNVTLECMGTISGNLSNADLDDNFSGLTISVIDTRDENRQLVEWDKSESLASGWYSYIVIEPLTYYMGDIDGNGKIDVNDYALMVSYIQCSTSLTAEQLSACDLNKDTAVDACDAIQLDLYLNHAGDINGNSV